MAGQDNQASTSARAVALSPAGGQALALLDDLTAQARANHENIVSPRTRKEYAKCWAKVEAWCADQNLPTLPIHIGTVILYATWLQSVRGYSPTSIDQAVSAIKHRHRMASELPIGQNGKPTAWRESGLGDWLKSLRRTIVEAGWTPRMAKALTDADLREVFDLMRAVQPREIRDAAIMALAYAACKRRSEVAGLDYGMRGPDRSGSGVLQVVPGDAGGIALTLHRSKTHQDGAKPEEYFLRRRNAPRACGVVEAWLRVGGIALGTPVFRPILGTGYELNRPSGELGVSERPNKKAKPWRARWKGRDVGSFKTQAEAIAARDAAAGGAGVPILIKPQRLAGEAVSDIIKTRMFQVLRYRRLKETSRKRLRPEEVIELKAEADLYSGHSARRGHITSERRRGRLPADIKRMSGHKTEAMIAHYTEAIDIQDNNSMEGSGL